MKLVVRKNILSPFWQFSKATFFNDNNQIFSFGLCKHFVIAIKTNSIVFYCIYFHHANTLYGLWKFLWSQKCIWGCSLHKKYYIKTCTKQTTKQLLLIPIMGSITDNLLLNYLGTFFEKKINRIHNKVIIWWTRIIL